MVIRHITLQTGDVRMSPRSEVAGDVIRFLRPIILRALRGERVAVPGQVGYSMTGGVQGGCCAITISGQMTEAARPQPVPIVTVGIAADDECAGDLWRALHSRTDLELATDPMDTPPAPWVADRLDVGAATFPAALYWTADLSRCLAWTWIEHGGG